MSPTAEADQVVPDYRPRFPAARGGVAILGCGQIAQSAHLPAYEQYGVGVVGVWSRRQATTAQVRHRFPFVQQVYPDVNALLEDPDVRIVDIATGPRGRMDWIEAAVSAGKHVLAQKPLTTTADGLARLVPLLERASALGLEIAVNQNARWAPTWRLGTQLIRAGAIGEVVGVTHLHDKPLPPLVGTPFDDVDHMLITDYLMHWLDISRCWLEGTEVQTVQANESRVPGQPPDSRNPWAASVSLTCSNGATSSLRIAGNVHTARPSCPFWVHGTQGTLRGSVLPGTDPLVLDRDGTLTPFALEGQWFVDGFAGTMGELMCAIDEGREPENSAAHVAASIRLMLAARVSVETGGVPVALDGLELSPVRGR